MVSVVIPIYNGEKYIPTCLDSLQLDQNNTLEVIAVNDGSKDSSLGILCQYAERFPNLKVIDQENTGAAQARKRGIAEATGDFITFLDVDDWVDPCMYANMEAKALESHADIVICDYVEEYPGKAVSKKNAFAKNQSFPLTGVEAIRYLHSRRAVFSFPWNKIYRADLLRQVEFPSGNFVGEDYNMLLQLFEKTDRIDYLALEGYHYVLTEDSASRAGYGPSTLLAYENFQKDYEMVCRLHPEMKQDVTNYLMIEYMAFIIAMGRNRTYNQELIKEIKQFVKKGFRGFIKANYVSTKMKGSATALCISYRLLIAMYRLLSK